MTKSAPQIRGGILNISLSWIRDAYGAPLYQRAMTRLSEEDRAVFRGSILPVSWYPLAAWVRFLDAVRAEVKQHHNEDEDTFDRRNLREAGGRFLQRLYRAILSLVTPDSAITKLPLLIDRSFDQGSTTVLENSPGHCRVLFRGPEEMYSHLRRFGPGGAVFLLEYTGARDITLSRLRDECHEGEYAIEVELRYQSGR